MMMIPRRLGLAEMVLGLPNIILSSLTAPNISNNLGDKRGEYFLIFNRFEALKMLEEAYAKINEFADIRQVRHRLSALMPVAFDEYQRLILGTSVTDGMDASVGSHPKIVEPRIRIVAPEKRRDRDYAFLRLQTHEDDCRKRPFTDVKWISDYLQRTTFQ